DPPRKDYYPRAITDDLYYKALAQRASNRNHKGKRGTKEINLFGGICKCHKCGGNMVKYWCKNKNGVKYEAIVCARSKISQCRPAEFTNWRKFQQSFKNVFCSKHFESFVKDSSEPAQDRTGELKGKLIEVTNNIQRVVGILARIPSPALENELSNLETDRK